MAAKRKKADSLRKQNEALRYTDKVRGWISQTAMLFVLAIFLLHPLYIDRSLYTAITAAKQGFFRACVILFASAVFLLSLTTSGFYRKFRTVSERSIRALYRPPVSGVNTPMSRHV